MKKKLANSIDNAAKILIISAQEKHLGDVHWKYFRYFLLNCYYDFYVGRKKFPKFYNA